MARAVDIAEHFREYVRPDKQRREEGLTPAGLQRWQALKQNLSIHSAPDRSEKAVAPAIRCSSRRGSCASSSSRPRSKNSSASATRARSAETWYPVARMELRVADR